MKITLFRSLYKFNPVEIEWTPAGSPMFPRPDSKDAATYAVAGTMVSGATARVKNTIEAINFLILDYDDVSKEQWAEVKAQLSQYDYARWGTWSHDVSSDTLRMRVAINLTRPVQAPEWLQFSAAIKKHFRHVDLQCFDISRLHGMPLQGCVFETHEGQRLDVDAFMQGLVPVEQSVTGRRDDLLTLGEKLSRKQLTVSKRTGKSILAALKGEPLADTGERDNTMYAVAKEISRAFPTTHPEAYLQFFQASIDAHHSDEFSLDTMRDKLRRAYDAIQAPAPEDTYAAEQLSDWGGRTIRWIVQRQGSYYIFHEGSYEGPLTLAEAEVLAPRYLAKASPAGVATERLDPRSGERKPKTLPTLVREYGDVARKTMVDFAAQNSHYNAADRILYEAPTPLRPLTPQYDEACDAFLRTFQSDKLLDWLAVSTKLSRPCAALYVDGPAGLGKSLLAKGVARLWTQDGSFTPATSVFGQAFDQALETCPLVVADEALPERTSSTLLREFIQSTTRSMKRKYLAEASTVGAIRLMVLANGKEALNTKEVLTETDIDAIAERFLYIHVARTAPRFTYGDGFSDVNARFLQSEALPRHILWLGQNRDTTHLKGRFFFSDGARDLAVYLAVRTGIRSKICERLCALRRQRDLNIAPSAVFTDDTVSISAVDMRNSLHGVFEQVEVSATLRSLARNTLDSAGRFVVSSGYLDAWEAFTATATTEKDNANGKTVISV